MIYSNKKLVIFTPHMDKKEELINLKEIYSILKGLNIREGQLQKIKDLIDEGDNTQAWQSILWEMDGLIHKSIKMPIIEVEKLAKNVAKMWLDNGRLSMQLMCKDGKINGDFIKWHYTEGHETPKMEKQITIKDGLRVCMEYGGHQEDYKQWNRNGELIVHYKNGVKQEIK